MRFLGRSDFLVTNLAQPPVSQGLGRPVIGLVSDKFGRINTAGLGTLAASVTAFLLWILAGKYYAGLIIYALFGLFAGVIWPCVVSCLPFGFWSVEWRRKSCVTDIA